MNKGKLFTLLMTAALCIVCVGPAKAQTSKGNEYTDIIRKALVEYNAGRWDEARSLFERAHAINPNARTLRGMGRAAFESSDYVSTLKYLKQALEDDRKPLNDAQRIETQGIISQAENFVGRFKLRLFPTDASLVVGGYRPVFEGNELLLNAGEHDLIAKADGYQEQRLHINVQGGRKGELEFRLKKVPLKDTQTVAESPSPPEAAPISVDAQDAQETSSSIVPYLVVGSGGALLVGSAITGLLSYSAKSELDDKCGSDKEYCPPELKSTKERGEGLQIASFILLGTGVAAAVAGFLLMLVSGDEHEPATAIEVSFGCGSSSCYGLLSSRY